MVYQRPGAAEQCFGQNIGAQAFRGPDTIIQETGDCEEDHADDDGDVGDDFSGDDSSIHRGRMDRDYNEEVEMGNYNSAYEAGFSENQGDNLDNHKQGFVEDRTYAEERSFDAENRGFGDHRGNALMLQSNAAPSLQLSALIPVLVNSLAVFLLNDLC